MGQITSLFVHKVIRQTHESLDKRALLASVGVDPDAAVDPSVMVSDGDYYGLLERIAATDPNAIDLPLRTGDSMRCDNYGAFGLAFKSAPTLRGSYERAERYARVLTSVSTYEVRDADDGVYMLLHRDGERRLGLRLSNEATIASIASISREISSQSFQPSAIYFKHPQPAGDDEHERHFGCPVYFGTNMDALRMAPATVAQPNRLGDPSIAAFFDTHLDSALQRFDDEPSVDRQVRTEVSQHLSGGIPKMSEIAAQLGVSARTLQRRLADRGMSYQQLVDESRRQLAEKLLRETEYPLAEVAFLTGFSEQSAFNRAFRRWAGQTPRSYRLKT